MCPIVYYQETDQIGRKEMIKIMKLDMKSSASILLIPLIAGTMLLSCNSYELQSEADVNTISFSIDSFSLAEDDGPITKTSIVNSNQFIWAEGDTVGIYPNTGGQVYFAMESGAGASSAEFDGGGWDFKPTATYYSYYPFIGDIYLDRNKIPVSFVGQSQDGTSDISHIGNYDFMYTPGTSSESGVLNFSYHHMCCIIRPKVTLPAGIYTKLAITAPTAVFAKKGYFNLQASTPEIIPTELSNQIIIDLNNIVLASETTFQIYVLSAPVNLLGTEITVSVLDNQKKERQCAKTPSYEYTAGFIGGLTCSSWVEVPQNMGMIIEDWGNGGSIGGDAQ